MRNTHLLLSLVFLLNTAPSWGQHAHHAHLHQEITASTKDNTSEQTVAGTACQNIINVQVNGLVCDFCARALEKVFNKRDDITGIDVDLRQGQVKVANKPNTTIDDQTLTRLITDSGYNVVAINRGC